MTDITLQNFDWEDYISSYADLRRANINTKEKAWNHWNNHGKKEKRTANTIFNIISDNNIDNKNIKCSILTMNKNEKDLLEAWILYYANLFSYNDLCIVDNGSTDKDVIDILQKYSTLGVRVIYDYNKPKDFLSKGTILKNLAQQLFKTSDYVFFLDVDEFLYLNKNNIRYYNKSDILNYLSNLSRKNKYVYKITTQSLNIPKRPDTFTNSDPYSKVFFQGGTVKFIDIGFHNGISTTSREIYKTELGVIHYHNKSYREKLQSAREKMKLRVNINSREAIKNYRGDGAHLKTILLQSEEEYYNSFSNITGIIDTNFTKKLLEYGADIKI